MAEADKGGDTTPVKEPVKEEQGLVQEDMGIASWKTMLGFHIIVTSLVNAVVSVLTWVLWSSIFYGDELYKKLDDWNWISFCILPVCLLIIFVLYMLDFFWPHHLNEMFVLWPGDRFVGRGLFAVAMILFVLSMYLNTYYFASLPLMISIILCPMATLATRMMYDPFKPKEGVDPKDPKRRRTEIVQAGSTEDKMRLLKRITGEEQSESMFYLACLISFGLWCVINLCVFLFGTVMSGPSLDELTKDLADDKKNPVYMQWLAPLVMGIANLVYGIFAAMRVAVQRAYSRTDRYKNQLIADLSNTSIIKDVAEHKKAELLISARCSNINELEQGSDLKQKQEQYLKQHAATVNQLSTILKGTVCFFVVLLGLCYSAGQLLYSDTHIATMVAGTMGVFFLIFCIFSYISLHRVVKAMGQWIVELPAWQMFQSLLNNAWVRAMCLCVFIPLIPAIMLLSWMNQKVRKSRGIYNLPIPEEPGRQRAPSEISELNPQDLSMTPRVSRRIDQIKAFPWLAIIPRIYICCFAFFCYAMVTTPLKVGLAGMNKAIDEADIHYALVLVAIFLTGIFLFLLPPVPGAVMYMFGGLISADQCPWGFWPGAFISLALGLVMKLVACAMQQAGIGGLLGRNLWVRQTAGVHKTAVRCVEKVLRQKGFTAGKVAILCGGPDWPTSVLAGILGLSVIEMNLGTLPIFFFITPFGLSGSLMLKSGEGGMWTSSAQLMLVAAALSSLAYWAVAAWSCQQVLEKHRDEVTRPLKQNVDLEWLDYRGKVIENRAKVTWRDVPQGVKILAWVGAVLQIMTCYIFQFGFSYLVGSFELNNDVSKLEWVGWTPGPQDDSDKLVLFSYIGLGVIAVYVIAWLGYVQHSWWYGGKIKAPKVEAIKELNLVEAQWKQEYLQYCDNYGQTAVKGPPDPLGVNGTQESSTLGGQAVGDSVAAASMAAGLFVSV